MSSVPAELISRIPSSLQSIVENFWADWCQSCQEKAIDPEQSLPLAVLGQTWACSDFVARNCIRYPEMLHRLHAEGFELARTIEHYREIVGQVIADSNDDAELMKALRVLRQQEMLRIAWRDLNALAEVETILHELSDFAEIVVEITLQHLEKQQAEIFGMPRDDNGDEQSLLVFAMGKMGGRELNFSSDIDLIFTFAEDGETPGPRRKSHYEFYLAVIRKLVKVLDEVTQDGFVYRVDTRLRPYGQSGPMAMSFSGLEQYYQLQGRDWERYAMIKAKLISGRESDRQYLQSMLTPFVYRRYLDFSMIESIREMKAMINAQMKRKRMINNIKLGHGGIREIEFIGQTLQLIRAGREPELRERSIIKVLTLLAEKNYLQKEEVSQLIAAYWFLRKLENCLQMLRDMQTHVLPDDELSQQRLCLAMQKQTWDELLSDLSQHQKNVDQIFQHLITPVLEQDNAEQAAITLPFILFWEDAVASDEVRQHLLDSGYADVDEILKLLSQLRHSPQVKHLTGDSNRRLAQLVLSLLDQIVSYPQQYELLDRVSRILKALAGRKVYISLLNEYPPIQQQMLKLCAASEWFTERLLKHPILLDSLLTSVEVFRQQYDVKRLLDLELNKIEHQNRPGPQGTVVEDDLEQQMDRMRQFKRQMVFSVAVLDVFYEEPVETVSDRLTELANALLEKILSLSWQAMLAKYGEPQCIVDGEVFTPAMSIIAYGKMGGNELGYGSDLDIIFLHNSSGEKQVTAGEKSIDNQSFFARVAQRVIHFLSVRTYSGLLYEVDTRLRPDGKAGLMVSSLAAFEAYQHEKAWTWEHQALIRARFVTGNALIEQEFDRIRNSVLRQPTDVDRLLHDVVMMREKMRKHLANKSTDFDIKQDDGGLVDIEFMTQAGVLMYAEKHADCIQHTATLRLIKELTRVGWYTADEADAVANAYRYFRKMKNWQTLKCEVDDSEVEKHRDKVMAVWDRLMPDVTEDVE
jgi:glutamate-ammonia-ligase adenylyltransferase